MIVIIIGRTRMKSGLCIGALCEETGRRLRLIPPGQLNQPKDCPFMVGQRWEIECGPVPCLTAPHLEDVWVYQQTYLGECAQPLNWIAERNLIDWRGNIQETFGEGLQLSPHGRCFFPAHRPPAQSTGFWQTQNPIIKGMSRGRDHYMCFDMPKLVSLPYVGEGPPAIYIPPNAIVRLSLSRLFTQTSPEYQGYYLQLSGYLGLLPELAQIA